jgi:regulator of protease activity HflC (stomatin/prohibitin superfamily)
MKKILIIAVAIVALSSCNRPESNYEGVLMTEYGRNGINSFKTVTGAQGPLFWGSELYEVPMWEQTGDPAKVDILTKDGSLFKVDPSYTYNPTRLHGPNIVLQYKNYDVDHPDTFFNAIEANVLNRRVTDAYREEARKYTTADALMNNVESFENKVNDRLLKEFAKKHFDLTTLTSGLKPPKSMTDAIEARNVAIQEANKVENQLNTARKLQEKAIIDAETNRINAAGLDSKILQARWINAIRYTENKVIITDGRTPFILGQ